MSTLPYAPVWVAFGVAIAAAALLPRVASRVGWVDDPEGPERARKLQPRPVPAIGGAVVLLGVLAGWALLDALGRGPQAPATVVPGRALGRWLATSLGSGATLFPLGAVVTAFAVGLVDDLLPRGLGAASKVLGQALAGAVLGAPLLVSSAVDPAAALAAVLLLAAGAVVCLNAINTFDNADGAAGSLVALALAWPAPLLAAPVIAFLPFNLVSRRRAGRTVPSAYLGDSGSHLLGMLVLLTPAAWPVLALPLFDLARLATLRSRTGSAPWTGDRRHLAHRLAAAGVSRPLVPAALLAVALPSAYLGAAGVLATAGLFGCAVAWTRDPGGPVRPRGPDPEGPDGIEPLAAESGE